MEKRDISIIVPIYHGKQYIDAIIAQIEKCIKKLEKKYMVELLLVNDAPEEKLGEYCSESMDIVVLNTDCNRGIHGARVRGLESCQGEFVLFLDQDDKITEDYLQSQISKMDNCDAIVCRAIHAKKCKYDVTMPFENVVSKEYMITQGNAIVSPGQVLLRESAISNVWKTNILTNNGADDWFLWICMMSEGKSFTMNEEILYEHVVNGQNTSWQSLDMIHSIEEIAEIFEKNHVLNKEELLCFKNASHQTYVKCIRLMDKYRKMFFVYDAWLKLYSDNRSISGFLKEKQYNKVAIYGDGYLGKQLYRELKRDGIEVSYFIDRNAAYLKEEIPVYTVEGNLPKVDMVISTLTEKDGVDMTLLEKKLDRKVFVLNDLIEEISLR